MTNYIKRALNLQDLLKNKSTFLYGPRQTGKSTLIRQTLGEHKLYNLLDRELFLRLSRNPSLIREEITPGDRIIVIDEIQKLPDLLDEVHLMIEQYGVQFLLTGSSARSLRRKGVNLLGGRARSRILHPFVRSELKHKFQLDRALDTGLIPGIYFSDDPHDDLKAYAGNYLQEEIAAEALVRNIGAFSRFLQVAGLCHGQMINFSQLANDAQVPVSTVREYFYILQDTLIACEVPALTETRKRKAISTAKYYLFDIGLVRYLQGRRGLAPGTPEYGQAFESYIFQELKAWCDYHQIDDLRYWRSKSQFEVDFIIDHRIAIEVKAKANISARDMKGLRALQEENIIDQFFLVCKEKRERNIDGIRILPWENFLDMLWAGEILQG